MGGFNYVLGLRAMASMAQGAMNDVAAAAKYTALADTGTREFHARFYNEQLQAYGGDAGAVQTLTTPALAIGSAPTAAIGHHLVQTLQHDLVNNTNYTLRVGAVTSKLLLNVLSENGLHGTALRAATNTAEDSWGFWLEQNATTCFEAWSNTPHLPSKGTLNHIFLCGGIGHWMWKHLAGIAPLSPGFGEVSIRPLVHDKVGPASVRGDFLSPQGMISVSWALLAGGRGGIEPRAVSLNVTLPIGVLRASVVIPKPHVDGKAIDGPVVVLESGEIVWDGAKLVGKHDGIFSAADQTGGIAFSTSNGGFAFEARRPPAFAQPLLLQPVL